MNKFVLRGISRGLFICSIIIVAIFVYNTHNNKNYSNADNDAAIGGPFELVGKGGKIYTHESFIGKPLLIFFGFASCPDICPYGLTVMSEVLDYLEEDKDKFNSVFVTLDPERDDYAMLNEFVNLFHSNIIGLSGTVEQIDNITKNWRVYKKKVKIQNSDLDYSIDHSAFIYLMDREGKYFSHFSHNVDARDIINTIQNLM